MQTWKIKGQVYTLEQLREMKRQGIDPRTDDVVLKFITNPKGKKDAIIEPKEQSSLPNAKKVPDLKAERGKEEAEELEKGAKKKEEAKGVKIIEPEKK